MGTLADPEVGTESGAAAAAAVVAVPNGVVEGGRPLDSLGPVDLEVDNHP